MKLNTFPFSALVGQEAMKTALILNAVDPTIGGVLIRGHKGTGKTTAVRSLRSILPALRTVKNCPYNCDPSQSETLHDGCRNRLDEGQVLDEEEISTPLVELPLNATEDRIVGTLQIEAALASGEKRFEPGLLASANRGILYIDEVNLLEDHLVDLLLDAAATGVNVVEREGISYSHPSRFILIGTMNPEEGELRPQFLDRFGLSVSVTGIKNETDRFEIVKRRLAFERRTGAFLKEWEDQDKALSEQIQKARGRCASLEPSDAILQFIVKIASNAGSAGHRAEITMLKAASALAAFVEDDTIGMEHVREAARLVLPHRIETGPFQAGDAVSDRIEDLVAGSGERGKASTWLNESELNDAENPGESRDGEEDYAEEFGIDPSSLEDMQVPGPTAAGSIVFTFLKKKLHINPTDPRISFSKPDSTLQKQERK